ncbi:dynamin family protein [Kutzneria kofuensis]|uniref:dynamin family protein n=1 Tax=Kutzneria kofuensis TaxID=103725 RepID=UPI0031F120DB
MTELDSHDHTNIASNNDIASDNDVDHNHHPHLTGAVTMPPTAAELLDLAIRATTAYRREDLGARLAVTRRRLLDPEVRVLVVGEFKQGKSMLVNSLVDAPVCPVDDDLATAVPTLVRYAPEPSVVLVGDDEHQRRPVPIDQLARHVSEAGNPGNRERLRHAEVGVPRTVLSGGLCLVDTPGVGGLDSAHGASTMAVLPTADAVILVSDAAQEYTGPELDFLRQAMKMCPTVLCVLTKTDLYPLAAASSPIRTLLPPWRPTA